MSEVDYAGIIARRRARARRLLGPILLFIGATCASLVLMLATGQPLWVLLALASSIWMFVALVREVRVILTPPPAASPEPRQPNIVE